ncbi:MAG TPA: hypothetical protein VGU27_12030 [Candidatus Eisenbacteria bacterium]|nr:hypothetical protein [Candidatus Eisenbacteria bacterium]
MTARGAPAQAFVETRSADPAAVSALGVARAHLGAGRALAGVRRLRLFELAGALPEADALAALLHRSIQFYNPAKERCTVRTAAAAPAPFEPEERLLLVFERGGERRPAAERWWRHETGARAEVREGVVWALRFAAGADADAAARELAVTTARRHGLFCNPHFEEWRTAPPGAPPLRWMAAPPRARAARRGGGGR